MPLPRYSVALRGGECVHYFLRICPLVLKALIRVMTWVPGMLAEVRSQAVAGFTDGDFDDRSEQICLRRQSVPLKQLRCTNSLRTQQTCSGKPGFIHKVTAYAADMRYYMDS